MTRSTTKKLTEPLDEPEREFRRRRRAAWRQQQNESLAIAGEDLFDDEASSSNNTGAEPLIPSKTLHGHSLPSSAGFQNPITIPAEQTGRIVNTHDIFLIQGPCTFQGLRSENPIRHIKHYLSIVGNIRADGATRDTSRLGFFHFSLKGKVKEWIDKFPTAQITTWDQLVARFLNYFFPIGRTSFLRDMILRFKQGTNEPIKSVWICFQDSIKQVPHYGIQKWLMPTQRKNLINPYLICRGAHEADECHQNRPPEHVCLSRGDIYDDPSLLRFYQNDNVLPWGNSRRKEVGESSPDWVIRSKFEDELAGFMLEKKFHTKGLGEMLDQHHLELAPVIPLSQLHQNRRLSTTLKEQSKKKGPRVKNQASCETGKAPKAMIHMPKGEKVLKDFLLHKEKLEKAVSSVKLSEECSTVIQRSLPQKKGDPGSFTLPCISKLKPTRISIQLADRSIKYHVGVCENLLVMINKFIFLVNFVVLEMDEDDLVPIILGRPFLTTARAVIDVHKGKLDTIDHNGKWVEVEEEREQNEIQAVSFYPRPEPVEPLEQKASENRLRPSSLELPKLELKELPEHLEYAFLQKGNQLPVVISSALSAIEKARLLDDLKNHKGVIAWSIADIKGIDSSFCTHKILMEDEFKPSVQPQRRVNRNIKEVVKKEVIKLLDARLIYPISDSPWVSPVQVVPKKGGMTIVKNEKDELIPQRTLIEDNMEVFMDDFSIFGSSFDHYLKNLEKMLRRCEETNLVLNWEKCHFMVKEGIVLDHKVSGPGIEVDKEKIKTISKLPYPTNVKAIRSFLGHAGFYKRFIKDFSQVARPMTQLLVKDAPFNFSKECIQAYDKLKHELTRASIMIKSDWSFLFEIMCEASDYVVGAVLGQKKDKHFQPIHYASKTLNEAQENYTTTENELLDVVFTFDKFRQYLVLSKTIIHDKKGTESLAADHMSRLENPYLGKLTKAEIRDLFPEEQLMTIFDKGNAPWYADFANYLASRVLPFCSTRQEKKKFFNDLRHYLWDEPFLFKQCADQIIRRCVAGNEAAQILRQCHSGPSGGHHGITITTRKVFKAGFYWPNIFRDA
ncbi:reverse transcriptase domain-containing protein [Tanacetum coccineum]|uniref:Reverse transcriptase domain-containing protein n=1 Tax=Tanacetum coccineum TaxID=301880 RepID=A0ABQ5EEN8_9ASTR